MSRYAVLLRGVNVGGKNMVPMPRLRELAAELGYGDVATYVQSGNLVVTAKTRKPVEVERAVAEAIRADLGLEIAVMVRDRDQLAAALAGNPFSDIVENPAWMHISFLASQPERAKLDALDRGEFEPERFEFGERCMYLWYPGGSGRSKLAAAPWDRRLGVRGTARNVRTVAMLLDMLDAPAT